jgi:hypothetical protein
LSIPRRHLPRVTICPASAWRIEPWRDSGRERILPSAPWPHSESAPLDGSQGSSWPLVVLCKGPTRSRLISYIYLSSQIPFAAVLPRSCGTGPHARWICLAPRGVPPAMPRGGWPVTKLRHADCTLLWSRTIAERLMVPVLAPRKAVVGQCERSCSITSTACTSWRVSPASASPGPARSGWLAGGSPWRILGCTAPDRRRRWARGVRVIRVRWRHGLAGSPPSCPSIRFRDLSHASRPKYWLLGQWDAPYLSMACHISPCGEDGNLLKVGNVHWGQVIRHIFRHQHADGEKVVVAQDVNHPSIQTMGEIRGAVESLAGLVRRARRKTGE